MTMRDLLSIAYVKKELTPEIINHRNNNGQTLLHLAYIHGVDSNIIESLIAHNGADNTIIDVDGHTPSYYKQPTVAAPVSTVAGPAPTSVRVVPASQAEETKKAQETKASNDLVLVSGDPADFRQEHNLPPLGIALTKLSRAKAIEALKTAVEITIRSSRSRQDNKTITADDIIHSLVSSNEFQNMGNEGTTPAGSNKATLKSIRANFDREYHTGMLDSLFDGHFSFFSNKKSGLDPYAQEFLFSDPIPESFKNFTLSSVERPARPIPAKGSLLDVLRVVLYSGEIPGVSLDRATLESFKDEMQNRGSDHSRRSSEGLTGRLSGTKSVENLQNSNKSQRR